jgi:hypothetical protein
MVLGSMRQWLSRRPWRTGEEDGGGGCEEIPGMMDGGWWAGAGAVNT